VQQNAAVWDDVIDENGLVIGHDGSPTDLWRREDQEGKLVIDLTLPNQPTVRWTILADDYATGSGHAVIKWKQGADRHEEAD